MRELTARQQEVLDRIKAYIREHGTAPTRAELAADLGLADPSSVRSHLKRLGPVNTYLSASKMSTKWMKPMNITSSFSNRENIRR